ncbi:uncharacterized protein LOC131842239 [Achroia grisella]|uniref:uncharacterized protein LOC131842239 n=1 Tax=Achroia grisella TaxID=688607 RepID=UPI0027D2EA56|nr:uncharacterized protein LOC131842239 [Achroia grisella]
MEWNKRNTTLLIEYFKEKRELWDSKCDDYRDRGKKHDAWIDLAKKFDIDKSIVERKVRNLIGQFQRELRKSVPGREADEINSKWFGFQLLLFLKDKYKDCSSDKSGILEEHISIEQETEADEEYDESLCEKYNKTSLRKRRLNRSIDLQEYSKKSIANEFNISNHPMKDKQRKLCHEDEDDCVLYGKLLAMKLRHFSQIERQKLMFEIDNLLLNRRLNENSYSSNNSYTVSSPPEIIITKRSLSECGSYDSSPSSLI